MYKKIIIKHPNIQKSELIWIVFQEIGWIFNEYDK